MFPPLSSSPPLPLSPSPPLPIFPSLVSIPDSLYIKTYTYVQSVYDKTNADRWIFLGNSTIVSKDTYYSVKRDLLVALIINSVLVGFFPSCPRNADRFPTRTGFPRGLLAL